MFERVRYVSANGTVNVDLTLHCKSFKWLFTIHCQKITTKKVDGKIAIIKMFSFFANLKDSRLG